MTCAFTKRELIVESTSREAIRELNLSFLILSRQLIAEDRDRATLTLGIDRNAIDLLAALSPAQIIQMANSDLLLCAFRFDDRLLLNLLADHGRPESVTKTHAAIVALTKPVVSL
jgi:flagellar transcriptional activator FlhD